MAALKLTWDQFNSWVWDSIRDLQHKVATMANLLDTLKSDFEAYKAAVDAELDDLKTRLTGALDPAQAQLIDDEINAAKAALLNSTSTTPAP